MTRQALPLEVADLSAFARALRSQLAGVDHPPGHLEMLNLLARAAGYRNLQHLRAAASAQERLSAPPAATAPADAALVEKVARHFDASGIMLRWPARLGHQMLCLWVLWSRIPAGATFTEREISAMLGSWHAFGDHALLRRALYEAKLVQRSQEGRQYRRIEQPPPPEFTLLLRRIAARAAA